MEGMNVDVVRQIARDLQRQSSTLESVSRRVDSLVSQIQSQWRGPDAVQFVTWWRTEHRPKVLQLAMALDDLGQAAQRNSDDQERASDGQGSGRAPVFGPGAQMPVDALIGRLRISYQIADGGSALTEAAFGDAGVTLLLGDAIKSGTGLIELFDDPSNVEAWFTLGDGSFSATGDLLKGPLGSVFQRAGSGLGAIGDYAAAVDSIQNGEHWTAGYEAVHGTAAVAGTFFPPIGWGVSAWDAGVGIGTYLGNTPAAEELQDGTVDVGLERVGGDASKLVERYAGVPGAWNMACDYGEAFVRNPFGLFN